MPVRTLGSMLFRTVLFSNFHYSFIHNTVKSKRVLVLASLRGKTQPMTLYCSYGKDI